MNASGYVTARRKATVSSKITGKVVESGKPIVVPRVSREPALLNRAARRGEAKRFASGRGTARPCRGRVALTLKADIKTITMLGGHAMTAVTAITAPLPVRTDSSVPAFSAAFASASW